MDLLRTLVSAAAVVTVAVSAARSGPIAVTLAVPVDITLSGGAIGSAFVAAVAVATIAVVAVLVAVATMLAAVPAWLLVCAGFSLNGSGTRLGTGPGTRLGSGVGCR